MKSPVLIFPLSLSAISRLTLFFLKQSSLHSSLSFAEITKLSSLTSQPVLQKEACPLTSSGSWLLIFCHGVWHGFPICSASHFLAVCMKVPRMTHPLFLDKFFCLFLVPSVSDFAGHLFPLYRRREVHSNLYFLLFSNSGEAFPGCFPPECCLGTAFSESLHLSFCNITPFFP